MRSAVPKNDLCGYGPGYSATVSSKQTHFTAVEGGRETERLKMDWQFTRRIRKTEPVFAAGLIFESRFVAIVRNVG